MTPTPVGAPRVTRPRALAAVAACLGVLALLGTGVLTDFGPQMDLDGAVSEALYAGDDRANLLNGLLEVLTAPGLTAVRVALFLPVVVLLVVRRWIRTALWVSVAVLGISPVTGLLKDLFGRVRPDFDLGGARYDSLSYPSGHSSGIATLVTVALLLLWPVLTRRARTWCLVLGVSLVLLVGLTRMWLGVHFLSDVLGGWSLGVAWSLLVATVFGGLPGGRAALPAREEGGAVTLVQSVVVEPDDGSLGPLLRVADDRLAPGASYGGHDHRAVDVVAVVLAGSLTHEWRSAASLGAGDVGVLRAGDGLRHDECAGPDGARVLQCYLRAAEPAAVAAHEVLRRPDGEVDLGRTDARLWLGRGAVTAPPGLVLEVDRDGVRVERRDVAASADGELAVLVWQLETARPAWAD